MFDKLLLGERWWDEEKFAWYLGASPKTAYRIRKSCGLHSVKTGNKVVIPAAVIAAFLRSRAVGALVITDEELLARPLLVPERVAASLRVSKRTITRLRDSHALAYIRVSASMLRIVPVTYEAWIKRLQEKMKKQQDMKKNVNADRQNFATGQKTDEVSGSPVRDCPSLEVLSTLVFWPSDCHIEETHNASEGGTRK